MSTPLGKSTPFTRFFLGPLTTETTLSFHFFFIFLPTLYPASRVNKFFAHSLRFDHTRDSVAEEVDTHNERADNEHLRHKDPTELIRKSVVPCLDLDEEDILEAPTTDEYHCEGLLLGPPTFFEMIL